MKIDHTLLSSAVQDFVDALNALYGHYLDTTAGFDANIRYLEEKEDAIKEHLPEGADINEMTYHVGVGDPNDPKNRLLHTTTLGEFRKRNERGGRNEIRSAQLLLVLIVTFWETKHRSEISIAMACDGSNLVKAPIMGDLTRIRHDVVHHRAIIRRETMAKISTLRGLKEGVEILLSRDDVEELVQKIKAGMDDLVVQAGGKDPLHRTLWHVK